jgi:hypothetical protein
MADLASDYANGEDKVLFNLELGCENTLGIEFAACVKKTPICPRCTTKEPFHKLNKLFIGFKSN